MSNITAQQLQQWLENNEAIVVDVREKDEFVNEHIPQACSFPLSDLENTLPLLANEKRKIVFQCLKGFRGGKALELAQTKLDSTALYNLDGGIESWKNANFPLVKKVQKNKLSIMRQVQIGAGSMVALFSLLSLSGMSFFGVLAMLVGCGLLFAGITGWCGLGILLQKMPWNK